MTMREGPGVITALSNLRYPRSFIQHFDFPNPWTLTGHTADDSIPPLWQAFPWLPYNGMWAKEKAQEKSESSGVCGSQLLTAAGTTSANLSSETSPLQVNPLLDPVVALKALEASPVITRALVSSIPRRQRSEKKPIPDELKDNKYYERRKRNNIAAKKSRDARKAREDEIALRVCFLEKENAILRAQVATLREEAHSLRQILVHKRHNRLC